MTTQTCNRDLLLRSLDDGLAEREEEDLARHLSECPACQRELEQLAGGQDDWSRVTEALRRALHEPATRIGDDASGEASYEAADFAVDFLDPAVHPHTLGRLGDIDIEEVIGRGGMGIVLKGAQRELNRPVAVKVLAPHLAMSGAARKRFAREAQAAAAIVHPHVMPILTVNSSGRLPYLVMPYIACESLQQRIDRAGSLELLDILRIGLQVARGLAAAHAQGLVHRDIKPANILLEKGVDRVMLTDFGLARAVDDASLTRTGLIAGTPQYMSPEQARGEPIDARSDLFSLGSVLYALCTGRPPFRAETSYGILRRVTDDTPRPIREINAEIPEWLAQVALKLLAKEPSRRFASAEEVAQVLEQCLAHVQQPSAVPLPESLRTVLVPCLNRKSVIAAGLALALCITVGALVIRHAPGWSPGFSRSSDDEPAQDRLKAGLQPEDRLKAGLQQPLTDWDDGAEQRLRDLSTEVDELTQRSAQDWDDPASFTSQESMP
jgi:serine/threonine-protein kinase